MALRAQVRVRWFLSILGIVSLPFLIAIFIFLRGERIIIQETSRVNQAQLNVLGTGLDGVIGDIRELEVAMIQDRDVEVLASGVLSPNNEYLTARTIIDRYWQLGSASGSSIDWIIFFPSTNKVLSSTTYTSDIHYLDKDLYGAPAWTLSRWRLEMRRLADRGIAVVPRTGWADQRQESVLVYSRHLPGQGPGDPAAVFVFVMTTPFVVDLLNVMLDRPDDSLTVFDGRSEIVLRSATRDQPNSLADEPVGAPGSSSTVAPWTYTYALQGLPVRLTYEIGDQGAMHALRANRRAGLGALIACLLAAIGLAGFVVKRQYGPIGRMVSQIVGSTGSSLNVESDEFRIIEDTLSRAMGETEELRSLVLGHERSLELYRFRARLRGGVSDSVELSTEFLQFANVSEYAVVLLDPVDADAVESVAAAAARAVQTPVLIVDVLRIETGICVVIGSRARITPTLLRSSAEQTQERLRSRIGIDPAAAVSRPYPVSHDPRAAVEEALHALQYRIVEGTSRVLEPHVTRVERDTFEFTLQQENELANRILAGDFNGARSVTEDVLHQNFELKELSIEMGRCLAFSLATMFVRSMNRVSRYRASSRADALRPIERIAACRTYEELRTTIVDLLQTVCSDIADGRASHTQVLLDQVEAFIHDQVRDPNLGTKIIADRFDMNAAYLSRVFKEHLGASFSDYINRRRVEIGKQLLSTSDRTIADIGQEIGYPESSSFIRFFKKFEGITPGVFRDDGTADGRPDSDYGEATE